MVLDGFPIFKFLHHGSACSAQQQGDDVTDHLKDLLYRLVHTLFHVLNGELLRLFRWLKPPLFYPTKLQKIIEKTKHFPDFFLTKSTAHKRRNGSRWLPFLYSHFWGTFIIPRCPHDYGFNLERFALGVYNELCLALGGLVEERNKK